MTLLKHRRRRLRKVVSWNAHVGRGARTAAQGLAQLIKDEDPDVIALQECQHYVPWFRVRFPLWKVYAGGTWTDSRSSPIMVRRSLKRGRRQGKGWGLVRVMRGWVYFETLKPHAGRTWTWARVEGVRILSLHRIPGTRGANRHSYNEEADRLVDWLCEEGPAIVIGDANESPQQRGHETMRGIAEAVDGVLAADRDDPGIDYALLRGVRGDLRRTQTYGSDHRAAVLTIRGGFVRN